MVKNFTLRVYDKKGKVLVRVSTHGIRRFLTHLRTLSFKKSIEKAYLRVSYGKFKNGFGVETFYNDGWFSTRKDLLHAFNAFNE